jgi:NAD+ synthase (glutamine-hydrolysing)
MQKTSRPFDSLYTHGFLRVAVCVPRVRVAAPAFNAEHTLRLARQVSEDDAVLALFPELGLSGYSNEDLFHQDALLDAALVAVERIVEESRSLAPVLLVGAPLRWEHKLFNCAIVVHRGRILAVVPKSYLPNYREFYEKRQFTSAFAATSAELSLLGQQAPFGNDIVLVADDVPDFGLHVEICEDLWSPIPPSTFAALAGATVLANLSASNITIGKASYRRELCAGQSAKCIAAYLYAAAGPGESTTDLAWDGHALIYENNHLLAESDRFSAAEQCIVGDIDVERLRQERMRTTSFNDAVAHHRARIGPLRRVAFRLDVPTRPVPLRRVVERFPYVPGDPNVWDERCFEAYNIQVSALVQRLEATGIRTLVIGVSGGLDSTHALIVCCRSCDRLGIARENVLAYTMPGFATSERTKANAWKLMRALGVSAEEIDIRPASLQMLADIGHPFTKGEPVHDVTFENVQAGQRTSYLFRLANHHRAMVVGTGDLSELALGWTTYGVGDHMSHYNVNGSVPKTLIQHIIRWVIQRGELPVATNAVLQAILDTEISPELVPGPGGSGEEPAQRTEEVIGPYDLQDFNLYYISRYGFRPSKVAYLAFHAWQDADRGTWPAGFPESKRAQYDLGTIKKWLGVFLRRFFEGSQFKRSAMPNAPKVGSGGSLSPRGDWRAPSDANAEVWLQELEDNVPG